MPEERESLAWAELRTASRMLLLALLLVLGMEGRVEGCGVGASATMGGGLCVGMGCGLLGSGVTVGWGVEGLEASVG